MSHEVMSRIIRFHIFGLVIGLVDKTIVKLRLNSHVQRKGPRKDPKIVSVKGWGKL